MKLTRGYLIVFALVLLPVIVWLGSDSVRQDITSECPRCGGTGHLARHNWCVWGLRWHKNTEGEIQPSLFLHDFPEFRCQHAWNSSTAKNTRLWGGPLFEAASHRSGLVQVRCGVGSPVAIQLYLREAGFREKLKEALQDQVFTRGQVVGWFEYRWIASDEPFELQPGEDVVFAKLDAMVQKFRPGGHAFAPLPVQGQPKAPDQF